MREKREKAIKFFQDMQECTYGNLEEVDMAIHALEQERNIIEELEKIKSEIKDYSKTLEFINHTTFVSEEKNKRFIELEDVNKLIAKAILELKG